MVVGACLRLEGNAVALTGNLHGNHDVVQQGIRRNASEQLPADGIYRTRGAHTGIDKSFALPDKLLITPVEPDATDFRAFGVVIQKQFTSYGSCTRVTRFLFPGTQRIAVNTLAHIHKCHNFPLQAWYELIQNGWFSLVIAELHDAYSATDIAGSNGNCMVAGSV